MHGGRTAALVATGVLAAFPAAAATHSDEEASTARKGCGTYSSESVYPRARVIAIRRVGCEEARRVAIRYDRGRRVPSPWRCFLAHDDRPRLFSCGYPPRGGDIRDSRYALEVVGLR